MNAANTVPAVLLHYDAPDAAQPAQMETNAPPVMLSSVDAAVQTLGGKKPILVAPDDVPAVLAQLAAGTD